MDEQRHEALHEAYDVDVAKLNRLAARSAERAEKLKAENEKLRDELDAAKHDLSLFSERIVELGAENAKLREQGARLFDKTLELGTENAKLRERVRKMMRFFEDGDYCAICEKAAECDAQEEYDDDCLMRGVFHAAMRELGIEVDG